MYERQGRTTLKAAEPREDVAPDTPRSTRSGRNDGEVVQRQTPALANSDRVRRTNLPPDLARGIESMSGMSMDGVRVHYNSSAPARVDAHAYAQGRAIHLAHGQEQHLAHEAWHVVQQAQGRVQPTRQLAGGHEVNDSDALEREADVMGARALTVGRTSDVDASTTLRRLPTSGIATQLKCKICGAKSHNANKCPKSDKSAAAEPAAASGRGQSKGGKGTRDKLETLIDEIGDAKYQIYGKGSKSLIGGYKGKRSSLKDDSARIDRQGLGNVQFQAGGETYATVTFGQDADADAVMAALLTSHDSGSKEHLT